MAVNTSKQLGFTMNFKKITLKSLGISFSFMALVACVNSDFEWDMRKNIDTSAAADSAASNIRAQADQNGVITYPTYQVGIARKNDTVASVAARVGVDAQGLARYNSLSAGTRLRIGEVLILNSQVQSTGPATNGASAIDVTRLAEGAIARAEGQAQNQNNQAQSGWVVGAQPIADTEEPVRHVVTRGETAFGIARSYQVSARNLADWNGLNKNLTVREGQILIIPMLGMEKPSQSTKPGQGTPTPTPPVAQKPLPKNETLITGAPASPNLAENRTAASTSRMTMPIEGKIIRAYDPKLNPGLDISAPSGSKVVAAENGVVAAITKDTDQVPILVVRHADNLLTVYARITDLKVAKGDSVKRGQTLAFLRKSTPAYLHFELRQGFDSIDPIPYLQ